MTDVLVALAAFVAMEPVTYLAHRFLMHGPAMGWHASHHARRRTRLEKNDLFPVVFAGITVLAMAAGSTWPSLSVVLSAGYGVMAYGAAYLFVHDVYIHGRLGRLPRMRVLEWLKESHRIHHLYGGEPYGMLLPVTVPKHLRTRAAASTPAAPTTQTASVNPF